jgi:putative ABC transport system substrate-binding protein
VTARLLAEETRPRRHVVLLALALVALAAPIPAGAQSPGKVWRIGLLSTAVPPPAGAGGLGTATFAQALRERGYVEGQHFIIIQRYAEGRTQRLAELAAELVGAKIDVFVTAGDVAALAAKKATESIPIVAATSDDPVAAGLAASLARPGGNVTGVVTLSSEIAGKRLEVLKEMLPRVARVGVLTDQGSEPQADAMQVAAPRLGVHLVRLDVKTADELDRTFERARKERVGAIIMLPSSFFSALRQRVISLAARHRLPALYPGRAYAEAGGLVAYGPDIVREGFSRAAILVDRILKGARPADLPFEQLTKIELVINARTARALSLTIPPSILVRAETVE